MLNTASYAFLLWPCSAIGGTVLPSRAVPSPGGAPKPYGLLNISGLMALHSIGPVFIRCVSLHRWVLLKNNTAGHLTRNTIKSGKLKDEGTIAHLWNMKCLFRGWKHTHNSTECLHTHKHTWRKHKLCAEVKYQWCEEILCLPLANSGTLTLNMSSVTETQTAQPPHGLHQQVRDGYRGPCTLLIFILGHGSHSRSWASMDSYKRLPHLLFLLLLRPPYPPHPGALLHIPEDDAHRPLDMCRHDGGGVLKNCMCTGVYNNRL